MAMSFIFWGSTLFSNKRLWSYNNWMTYMSYTQTILFKFRSYFQGKHINSWMGAKVTFSIEKVINYSVSLLWDENYTTYHLGTRKKLVWVKCSSSYDAKFSWQLIRISNCHCFYALVGSILFWTCYDISI